MQIPTNLRTFEHLYIGLLSLSLILFNNPIYGFIVVKNTTFFNFLGDTFIILYFSMLILFWIVMMDRIYKETILLRTKLLNRRNMAIFGMIFFVMLIYTIMLNYFNKYQPGFHFDNEYPIIFKVYQSICFMILLTFTAIFMWSVVKIFKNWNKLIPRHKFFFIFSFYFIIIFIGLTISFFDDFSNEQGMTILLFFVLNNFYVIMLQLLWRFSDKGQAELTDYKNEI